MTYTFNDAVDRINSTIEKMKSAPTQEERNNMDAIENSIFSKIIFIAWAIIAIITIFSLAILYCINYDGFIFYVLFMGGSPLLALCLPLWLQDCRYELAKIFSKKYKAIFDKYKHPFCSQESYGQEIVDIINNTDVFKNEANKSDFSNATTNYFISDEQSLVSTTLYFYDGFDENSKPKYKTQEIKFI